MDKIPIDATIARAYHFAFGKFFTLLGIVWLPMTIIFIASFVLMRQLMTIGSAIQSDSTASEPSIETFLLVFLAMMLLMLMQIIGLTEEALGRRRGPRWVYFSVGSKLWLLVGTLALFLLAIIGAGIATSLAVGLVTGLSALLGTAGRAVALFGAVAIFCALIYAFVRQSFLITPVVAAENRIGLKRAWALGKGNVWRMFAILLAVLVPVVAAEMAVVGFLFRDLPFPPKVDGVAQPEAVQAWIMAVMTRMTLHWYVTYPVCLVLSALAYGLMAGAQAFTYRALVPEDIADSFG